MYEMKLNPEQYKQIILAHYLFNAGIKTLGESEPISALGILQVHDAFEMSFSLACEIIGDIDAKGYGFSEYLKEFKRRRFNKSHIELLSNLNEIRVGIKHHRSYPSKFNIEYFKSVLPKLFHDFAEHFFEVDVNFVTLVDFVQSDTIKLFLKSAIDAKSKNDYDASITEIAKAYHEYRDIIGTSHLLRKQQVKIKRTRESDPKIIRILDEFSKEISERFDEVNDHLSWVEVGINPELLRRIRRTLPMVVGAVSGDAKVWHSLEWTLLGKSYTIEDIDVLLTSMIDLCLKPEFIEAVGRRKPNLQTDD